MHFGRKLTSLRHGPWIPYYLDYDRLKGVLEQGQEQGGEGGEGGGSSKDNKDKDNDDIEKERALVSTAKSTTAGQHHRRGSSGGGGSTGSASSGGDIASAAAISNKVSQEFLNYLNMEVEKISLFFLQELGRVAHRLAQIRQEQFQLYYQVQQHKQLALQQQRKQRQQQVSAMTTTATTMETANPAIVVPTTAHGIEVHHAKSMTAATSSSSSTAIVSKQQQQLQQQRQFLLDACHALYDKYRAEGLHILRLIRYVDINCTGVRKILKKHDKLFTSSGSRGRDRAGGGLSKTFFGKIRHSNKLLQPLLADESFQALQVRIFLFDTGWDDDDFSTTVTPVCFPLYLCLSDTRGVCVFFLLPKLVLYISPAFFALCSSLFLEFNSIFGINMYGFVYVI